MTVAANSQQHVPTRRFRRGLRLGIVILAVGAMVFVAGFFHFAHLVQEAARPADSADKADGIIVLTGGADRIADAIALLEDKRGQRLLISGVYPSTTARQLARRTGTASDVFHCCIDLGYAAQNTLGNAVESARWATENNFDRLILVTSAYHMPRAMMEFRRLMPEADLQPWPVSRSMYNADDWWRKPASLRLMMSEYSKYLLASARMRFGDATLPYQQASASGQ